MVGCLQYYKSFTTIRYRGCVQSWTLIDHTGPLPPPHLQVFTVPADEWDFEDSAEDEPKCCRGGLPTCGVSVPVSRLHTFLSRGILNAANQVCPPFDDPPYTAIAIGRVPGTTYRSCEFQGIEPWFIPDPEEVRPQLDGCIVLPPAFPCSGRLGVRAYQGSVLPPGSLSPITTDVLENRTLSYDEHNRIDDWTYVETARRPAIPSREFADICDSGLPNEPVYRYVYRVDYDCSNFEYVVRKGCRRAVSLNWTVNCDGSTAAVPAVNCTPCIPEPPPPPEDEYIVGSPCGGSPQRRIVIAPVANVRTCGVIQVGNGCYQFDPRSAIRVVGIPSGATVTNQIIQFPNTCCDCLTNVPDSACDGVLLQARDAWLNGQQVRDTAGNLTGFSVSQPYVSGVCCCSPGDRFQLVEKMEYVEDFFETGELFRRGTHTVIPVFNSGDATVDDFRRDAIRKRYGIRWYIERRDSPSGDFYLEDANEGPISTPIDGTVDCEWDAFDITYTFDAPHYWQGLPLVGVGAQIPRDVQNTLGIFNGSWGIVYYNLAATCDLLISDVRYERYDDPPPGPARSIRNAVTSRVVWKIVRDPNGPCAGGCIPPQVVIPPINPGDIPTPIGPGPGANSGGCAGCGMSGGL